ncbi:MAG: hypothetical protein OEQ53_21125 [Saprospiraceae bacterium]|nr:hypothetical protein [Saprospiraceae bacterium]
MALKTGVDINVTKNIMVSIGARAFSTNPFRERTDFGGGFTLGAKFNFGKHSK